MRDFDELYAWAAKRKGGTEALEALIDSPKSHDEIAAIPDDRWLAEITRRVFQAGFNWSVIDKKWAGFEAAFDGFDPVRWTRMSDEDLDILLKDTRIVRHARKVLSVRDNAVFIRDLAKEHGGAGQFFAASPATQYIELLDVLKTRASRMGGTTAQYFLRSMGIDAAMFSKDVCAALVREGVADKAPTSKTGMRACQNAFNIWMEQGAKTLNRVSRVLAFTVGD